jgi:hypothetical protein
MEVSRDELKLKDDLRLLSPPSLDPAWQCGTTVVVRGFVANAMLDVDVDGVAVATNVAGGFPAPNGASVPLPTALVAGQKVRARQTFSGATSDWCAPTTVRDHTVEFAAGPPRPEINPAPVYECGTRTGGAVIPATFTTGRCGSPRPGGNVRPNHAGDGEVCAKTPSPAAAARTRTRPRRTTCIMCVPWPTRCCRAQPDFCGL